MENRRAAAQLRKNAVICSSAGPLGLILVVLYLATSQSPSLFVAGCGGVIVAALIVAGKVFEKRASQILEASQRAGEAYLAPPPSRRHGERPDMDWVIEGKIAGGSWPGPETRAQLYEDGFRALINLTPRPYSDDRFTVHTIPIIDGDPPEDGEVTLLLRIVDDLIAQDKPIYVHCIAGCGRTGTLLACFLARNENLSGNSAIDRIRSIRPCSIENPRQEESVHIFARSHKTR